MTSPYDRQSRERRLGDRRLPGGDRLLERIAVAPLGLTPAQIAKVAGEQVGPEDALAWVQQAVASDVLDELPPLPGDTARRYVLSSHGRMLLDADRRTGRRERRAFTPGAAAMPVPRPDRGPLQAARA